MHRRLVGLVHRRCEHQAKWWKSSSCSTACGVHSPPQRKSSLRRWRDALDPHAKLSSSCREKKKHSSKHSSWGDASSRSLLSSRVAVCHCLLLLPTTLISTRSLSTTLISTASKRGGAKRAAVKLLLQCVRRAVAMVLRSRRDCERRSTNRAMMFRKRPRDQRFSS